MSKNSKKQIETRTNAQLVQDTLLDAIEQIVRWKVLNIGNSAKTKVHVALSDDHTELYIGKYTEGEHETVEQILLLKKKRDGSWWPE